MSKALRNRPAPDRENAGLGDAERASDAREGLLREIEGGLLIVTSVFLCLSLISFTSADTDAMFPSNRPVHNLCGPLGAWLVDTGYRFFGYGAPVAVLGVFVLGWLLLSRRLDHLLYRLAGGLGLVVSVATIAALLQSSDFEDRAMPGAGGLVGWTFSGLLSARLGLVGTLLAASFGVLLSLAVSADLFLASKARKALAAWWSPKRSQVEFQPAPGLNDAMDAKKGEDKPDVFIPKAEKDQIDASKAVIAASEAVVEVVLEAPPKAARKATPPAPAPPPEPPPAPPLPIAWELPPVELLEEPKPLDATRMEKQFAAIARDLEQILANFRIEAKVVGWERGPVLTMFELQLAPGIKLQQVLKLCDDIAMGIRVERVRFVAPIPGKTTLGIEVPNRLREAVTLRELITSEQFKQKKYQLPALIGKDAVGGLLIEDLARMPHILIAGTTGSGKSSVMNTLILSLLALRSPDDVRLIMIDPKMVELSMYDELPHLLMPVVTDMKRAPLVLDWAVQEMETRYELLSKLKLKHCNLFNRLSARKREQAFEEAEVPPELRRDHLPYIVIFVDEYADLMCVAEKEVEEAIVRIAQKARAVGIHLVLATQRPTVDVVTGLIKANMPARLALRVMARTESRTILDSEGAQNLLGLGDMLYKGPSALMPVRAQSCYSPESEIERLVSFWKNQSAPRYVVPNLKQLSVGAGAGKDDALDPNKDDLFVAAVDYVVTENRGSASLLQRALGIGYTRASRLIDMMRAEGIVGEHKGSQASEVMLSQEDWERRRGKYTGEAWDPSGADSDAIVDEYEDFDEGDDLEEEAGEAG